MISGKYSLRFLVAGCREKTWCRRFAKAPAAWETAGASRGLALFSPYQINKRDSNKLQGERRSGELPGWEPGRWCLGLTTVFLLVPQLAWAIQTHGDPEGLYAHQMGHVVFFVAMLFVCYQIKRRGMEARPGFARLYWACILFGAWNILTFMGHIAEERLDPAAIDRQGGHLWRTLQITDLNGLLFYLAKLDHLLLVPAFWLLFLALRTFRKIRLGAPPS